MIMKSSTIETITTIFGATQVNAESEHELRFVIPRLQLVPAIEAAAKPDKGEAIHCLIYQEEGISIEALKHLKNAGVLCLHISSDPDGLSAIPPIAGKALRDSVLPVVVHIQEPVKPAQKDALSSLAREIVLWLISER
jgi:hypothetical protein